VKSCAKCGQVKDDREFYPDPSKKCGLASYCRTCSKTKCVDRYKNNKETHDAKSRLYYATHKPEVTVMNAKWVAAHREQVKEYRREYALANKLVCNAHKRKWAKNNPDKVAAREKRRQMQQRIATPFWANKAKMAEFYKRAKEMSGNGVEYHADHIVPLKSELVCGLHVEANLAIVPASYNRAKRNTYWPYKYGESDSIVSKLSEWIYAPQPNVLT